MAKAKKKDKKAKKAPKLVYTAEIYAINRTTIDGVLVAIDAASVTIKYKKSRRKRYMQTVIPLNKVVYVTGGEIGGDVQVSFNERELVDSFDVVEVLHLAGGLVKLVDEEGVVTYVQSDSLIVEGETSEEVDSKAGKKSKKAGKAKKDADEEEEEEEEEESDEDEESEEEEEEEEEEESDEDEDEESDEEEEEEDEEDEDEDE